MFKLIIENSGKFTEPRLAGAGVLLLLCLEGQIACARTILNAGEMIALPSFRPQELVHQSALGLICCSPKLLLPLLPLSQTHVLTRAVDAVCRSDLLTPSVPEPMQEAALDYIIASFICRQTPPPSQPGKDAPEDGGINIPLNAGTLTARAMDYFSRNLDMQLDMDVLSQELGEDKSRIIQEFRKSGLGTPNRYFAQLKLEVAKKALEDENASISHIARSLGYRDVSSFTHFFCKHTGKSPREFRDALHWLL